MAKKIEPLLDRVLVKRDASEEVTPGGIFIPEPAKGKAESGIVVAVGPGKRTEQGATLPMSIKVGDRVMFNPMMVTELQVEADTLLLLREDDINAILHS